MVQKENQYRRALLHWKQYNRWLETRNPKRAKLEAAFGYDCKHALHLVRLMRMGLEILQEGKVIVQRPDAEFLLSVKNGAWSYNKLIKYAEEMDKKMQMLYENPDKCAVPYTPNRKKLNNLCVEIIEDFWRNNA